MAKKCDIECAKAFVEVDQRIGFKYRTVYLYDEDSKMHYHDYYEVFLILSSGVVHYINGEKMHLPRGTLVFIRKEDRHTFEYASTKEPSLCNLSFNEEVLQELLGLIRKAGEERQKTARISLNWPQAVLHFQYVENPGAPEPEVVMEEANEGEQFDIGE